MNTAGGAGPAGGKRPGWLFLRRGKTRRVFAEPAGFSGTVNFLLDKRAVSGYTTPNATTGTSIADLSRAESLRAVEGGGDGGVNTPLSSGPRRSETAGRLRRARPIQRGGSVGNSGRPLFARRRRTRGGTAIDSPSVPAGMEGFALPACRRAEILFIEAAVLFDPFFFPEKGRRAGQGGVICW